jgi:alcohol dehydrogenase class IV
LSGDSEKRFKATVLAKAQQHTPQTVMDDIVREMFPEGQSRDVLVLAVGGGSSIGVAKALAVQAPKGSGVIGWRESAFLYL